MKRALKLKMIRICPEKRKNAGETPALRSIGEKGSVLVESAISIVLLFLLLFAIVDFGRALYTYHFVANAAREATRWASVNGSSCSTDPACPNGPPASQQDIAGYVDKITPPGINPDALSVDTSWPRGTVGCRGRNSDAPGCPVQVTVSYAFNFLTPIARRGMITLSSSSEMIISH